MSRIAKLSALSTCATCHGRGFYLEPVYPDPTRIRIVSDLAPPGYAPIETKKVTCHCVGEVSRAMRKMAKEIQ